MTQLPSNELTQRVDECGWDDGHLMALTRDTSWWCPAGDWNDSRSHLLVLYTIAKWVCWPNPTWSVPAVPPVAVEIGVREGPSTVAILHAMRETGGKLISLECDAGSAAIATTLVNRAGLAPWWELHIVRSEQWAPYAPAALDFLWIDGDHHEDQVRADVRDYASRVRLNGMVALHDYWSDPACFGSPQGGPFPSDVSVVIEEMRASGQWEILTLPWSFGLTLCRKVAP